MIRQNALASLAVLAIAALLASCSKSGDDKFFITDGRLTLDTRADDISTPLEDSWGDNEFSFNHPGAEDVDDFRIHRFSDGSGVAVWSQGDDGDEHFYVAHFGSSGAMDEPFEVDADVEEGGYGDDSVRSFVAVKVPSGAILMAFVAIQDSDDSSATDNSSDRVYYMTWTPADGFEVQGPIDTNSSPAATDDNDVSTLFVVSNLIDGAQRYDDGDNDLTDSTSGSKGDSAANVQYGVFLGWRHADAAFDYRVEGRFIDLDTRVPGAIVALVLPTVVPGESVDDEIRTSGRDVLFTTFDGSSSPAERHLVLFRADFAGGTFGGAIDLDRGDSVNVNSYEVEEVLLLLGDGFRPIHGQDSTWVVFADRFHEDATTTQADRDLVVAQVDDAGAVAIGEFDHNGAAAANGNDVFNADVIVGRGATRGWLLYQQVQDVTGGAATNDALFARAIRFKGGAALSDNVSAEVTVNTASDADNDGDTDVVDSFLADQDPFCAPETDNDATYVVYQQNVDEDLDSYRLAGRRLTIDDVNADPITVTAAAEDVIEADLDYSWSGDEWGVAVVPTSDRDGNALVFFVKNGNNASDNAAVGAFTELRLFAFAAQLPTSASTVQSLPVTQIDSDSLPGVVPFPQWRQLTDTVLSFSASATPWIAAQRDFAFDNDTATPAWAHVVFPEYAGAEDSEGGERWTSRSFDYAAAGFTNASDRFAPSLDEPPAVVSDVSGEFDDLDKVFMELLPNGNSLLAIFNVEHGIDDGTLGRFYVNTGSAGTWSDAALITNDRPDPLVDEGQGPDGEDFALFPGVASANCDSAVGAWFVYVRYDNVPTWSDQEYRAIQVRRFISTSLPRP